MPALGKAAKQVDLVVFGEFFSDMIFYRLPDRPRFGEEIKTDSFQIAPGGLATTAQAASRLGSSTAVITRVGVDAESLPTWAELVASGCDISACEFSRKYATALTVCIAYHSDRMMVTHEPIHRNLEDLLATARVRRKLGSARHVHLACALRRPEKWLPTLRSLRDQGITISADFGWNPDNSVEEVIQILRFCEFTFPNEHEARSLTGISSLPRALEKLSEWVRVPVITLGARGAMLMADGRVHVQPALTQPILDATGAGDAFNGGFLHAFLRGSNWDDCLRSGNICGGLTVSAPGGSAGLPSQAEFHRHLLALRNGSSSSRVGSPRKARRSGAPPSL
ncbi:MAG: carbohydrate kinase family protein [Acidobacteriaceae bacterium]